MEGLLSGNLLSKASMFGHIGSSIKSIQQGELGFGSGSSSPYALLITAIDPSKTIVKITHSTSLEQPARITCKAVELINRTTVNVYNGSGTISYSTIAIKLSIIKITN